MKNVHFCKTVLVEDVLWQGCSEYSLFRNFYSIVTAVCQCSSNDNNTLFLFKKYSINSKETDITLYMMNQPI